MVTSFPSKNQIVNSIGREYYVSYYRVSAIFENSIRITFIDGTELSQLVDKDYFMENFELSRVHNSPLYTLLNGYYHD